MKDDKPYVVFMGSGCIDSYYTTPSWPANGEKADCIYIGDEYGGMIANAACVCAGYGVKTYSFDVKSNSPDREHLYESLESFHVDTSKVLKFDTVEDDRCMIFQFPNGDRTILSCRPTPARHPLTETELDFFRHASYVYGTIHFDHMIAKPKSFLKFLKENNVPIFFDIESNFYVEDWRDYVSCATTVSINEWGFERFAQGKNENEFIAELFQMGIENLLITLGKEGCRVLNRSGVDLTIPIYPVDVVDCTGAGDTMNGSFMACLLMGHDVVTAAKLANVAATMSVTKQGPRSGVTTISEIKAFIKAHEKCDLQ